MENSYRKVLRQIYRSNALQAHELLGHIHRTHNDHRDFYPMVALLNAGYVGFTGGVPPEDASFRDTIIAHTLQCYSQGPGAQSYGMVSVNGSGDADGLYFYIGPKGIEYFETRRSDNKKLFISACLSLLAGITVAFVSMYLKR